MTLTKAHLVQGIHNQLGLPKSSCAKLLESLMEIMKKTLASGEDVLISGFGRFCVRDKNERRGRNPQTGEDLILETRRVVVFKCSGVFRNKING